MTTRPADRPGLRPEPRRGAPGGVGDAGCGNVVERVVADIDAALDDAATASLVALDESATGRAARQLARVRARLEALELRVLTHAEDVAVGSATGAGSTAAWLAHATGLTRPQAHRRVHLASALVDYPLIRTALEDGAVNLDQVTALTHALDDLPDHLDPEIPQRAEACLVGHARNGVHARDLRTLGQRVLDLVAPEIGEAHEAAVLEREERAATATATLSMTPDGQGRVHGRFTLPELHAAILRKHLHALATGHHEPDQRPGDQPATGKQKRRVTALDRGRAFCELLERLEGRDAPAVGGTGATIVVTMTLEALQGGLAAAALDTGDRITAATARRLACEAGIIPVVLGGESQPLDLGRTRRYFTHAQRLAIAIRDRHCTATGCETAAWACHAHHDHPWSHGGTTDLAHGRLLCGTHHRRIHDPAYRTTTRPDNTIEFHRRT